MFQIISVDLDGTLLSSDNQITEYTKKVIKILSERKFYFILASGRHHLDILQIRDILKIKSFMITSNGARVFDLNNNLIFTSDISKNIALQLCKIVYSDQDIITQVYKNNRWYINNNKIENNFCPSLTHLKYEYFSIHDFKFTHISKIFFTSRNQKKLCNLEKKILFYWNKEVNISFSVPGCLEVMSKKTSKGHGLKIISNLMRISLDNFISFGDGMNDEDMLRISGKGCIMKNADIRLKNSLSKLEIIESNDDDGVAKYLDKIFIKNF